MHDLVTKTFTVQVFFNVRVAQDPKIHLQENEYLRQSAEWLKDVNKSSHFFFFLTLISKNEATSMRFFFNPSTVIYTQNKFRLSYLGSLDITGSPFVRDYYSRRLPRRGINLPWNNTSHHHSKEPASAVLTGCSPAQRELPTEPTSQTVHSRGNLSP